MALSMKRKPAVGADLDQKVAIQIDTLPLYNSRIPCRYTSEAHTKPTDQRLVLSHPGMKL